MTTYLGKSCLFGSPYTSFVHVYQWVCMLLSLLVLRMGCVIVVLVHDHCLLFYSVGMRLLNIIHFSEQYISWRKKKITTTKIKEKKKKRGNSMKIRFLTAAAIKNMDHGR